MGVPQVVIVGRPNVGKSSLFNWLAQKRLAIVDGTPGVTRDRMNYLMCSKERYFELVDTGGIGFEDPDNLTTKIDEQIDVAIESADVILFVVDTRTGITPLDQEVARRLRYVDTPIICVTNKADDSNLDAQADEFYKLGRGKLIRTSTIQNRGRLQLLDLIVDRLPKAESEPPESLAEPLMKVAIVGRRNVGKSTFVNTLAHAERMIVSEVAGTTRDSVDVRFELDGKAFMAIDNPGLRRTKSISTDIDFYSTHRAQRGIRRADVVLMFFDPTQRISKVDKQLCDYIAENYKPCVFVVNKWDLVADSMLTDKWVSYLHDTFRTMRYTPIAFITGKTGKNVKALLNHAQMLYKQVRYRATTAEVNRVVRDALERNPPPLFQMHRPRIYYATQVSSEPPTVVLFCNDPNALSEPYRRYLLGVFRERLPFAEVPIKLYLRKRQTGDQRDEIERNPGQAARAAAHDARNEDEEREHDAEQLESGALAVGHAEAYAGDGAATDNDEAFDRQSSDQQDSAERDAFDEDFEIDESYGDEEPEVNADQGQAAELRADAHEADLDDEDENDDAEPRHLTLDDSGLMHVSQIDNAQGDAERAAANPHPSADHSTADHAAIDHESSAHDGVDKA